MTPDPKAPHKDPRDAAIVALIEGMLTDGAHHKQYFLEKAMRELVHDEWVDDAKAHFGWQDGIAP